VSFEARNLIEERQAAALCENGIAPEEWTFEAQRRNWPGTWNPESLKEIRRYFEEGPSRLELIEAVGPYRFAANGIRRAAAAERSALRRFAIATDPSGQTRHDTFWWGEGEPVDHMLWINLGFWNLLKIITHQITWALVRPAGGDLMDLAEALGQFDDPTELALRLYKDRRPIVSGNADRTRWQHKLIWFGRTYPPFAQFPPEQADLERASTLLLTAGLTWAAGHEYGHALAYGASTHELGVEAERSADRWGIIAVLRGLDVVDDAVQAFRASWQGIITVLGAVTAILMTQAQNPDADEADQEEVRAAYRRLTGFTTALIQETARRWQICEVLAIGKCAATLVAAVIQWLLWEWGVEDPRDAGIGRLLRDALINGPDGARATINALPLIIPCTGQHGPAGATITLP
jgi:hypothetical protein